MPVQPPRSSRSVALGIVGLSVGLIAVLGLFVWAIPSLTEENKVEIQIGDDVFDAGPASQRADSIDRDGPVLFSDVASGQRDIYLQHVGTDPAVGWLAFDARRAEVDRSCTLQWQADSSSFTDPCDGPPVDEVGNGLRHYAVTVNTDGQVEVDLRTSTGTQGAPSTPTTAAPTTSTSSDIVISGR